MSEPDAPSPGELVCAALKGDPLAWAALMLMLRPIALTFALRRLRNRADAEDVAHETIATVVAQLGGLRERDAVVSWTLTIAMRIIINRSRRRREVPSEPEVIESRAQCSPAPAPEPRLGPAIAGLPAEQSAALVARHVDGMTWEEIAREQGVSVGTAKSRVRLARARLRTEFGSRQ